MRYLGIDYGTVRIGVAVSDEDGQFAFPRGVIVNRGLESSVNEVCALVSSEKIDEIVIGHSANLQGEDNPVMHHIRIFAEALGKECGKPVRLEPEFFTSIQATRITGETKNLDAQAAALILQSYLDKVNS